MRLKRLWNRYNPRRKYIDLNDHTIRLMAQLGYIELYRGEYFFTPAGVEALKEGIKVMKEQMNDSQ